MNGRGLTTSLTVVLLVLGTIIVGNAQRGRSSVLEDGPWTYRTADADVSGDGGRPGAGHGRIAENRVGTRGTQRHGAGLDC